jgi:ribosomal protein S18 acetylase RimI-like enzyme
MVHTQDFCHSEFIQYLLMKILIDTNIFIPLEPFQEKDLEVGRQQILKIMEICRKNNIDVYLHPATKKDIQNDKDEKRRNIRLGSISKYHILSHPPVVPTAMIEILGSPEIGSHDQIDHDLMAAVYSNAVDFFVTEDQHIKRKSYRVGIQDRVVSIPEILGTFENLFPEPVFIPRNIERLPVYSINDHDPIFESLRKDYEGFDKWLDKCKKEHREALVVKKNERIAGLCLFNQETKDQPAGTFGKVLKINTFKVSENFGGSKIGELLLKSLLKIARSEDYDFVFLTTFPKQEALIAFLQDFGFIKSVHVSKIEEYIFIKELKCVSGCSDLSSLEYSMRFGPGTEKPDAEFFFIIPIQPKYSQILFPDYGHQPLLLHRDLPVENTIRKVYLSHSNLKEIEEGAVLLFYNSQEEMSIFSVGIAEKSIRTSQYDELLRFIGNRSVYSIDQLQEQCKKEVLAVRFRESRHLTQPIHYQELLQSKIISGPIQSIQKIKKESLPWLKEKIKQ